MSRRLKIDIVWRVRRTWHAGTLLRRVARHVAAAEGFCTGQLSIAVVGPKTMFRLNQQFLKRPAVTDVLAFDLGCDLARGHLDGEIVVCSQMARQVARRHGSSPKVIRCELALYTVHGILHLAGYDDHTPAGRQRMRSRESQLLAQMGLEPTPYQDQGPPRPCGRASIEQA